MTIFSKFHKFSPYELLHYYTEQTYQVNEKSARNRDFHRIDLYKAYTE